MKKALVLLFTIALSITLCGCSNENKVTTSTCSISESSMKMSMKFSATNGEIDKVVMTVTPNNSTMGISSFKDLDDDMKSQIKKLFLSSLGLEKDSYDGVKIDVTFDEEMDVKLDLDLKVADKDILDKLGLDLDDTDMNLEKSVKELEESGYTCK